MAERDYCGARLPQSQLGAYVHACVFLLLAGSRARAGAGQAGGWASGRLGGRAGRRADGSSCLQAGSRASGRAGGWVGTHVVRACACPCKMFGNIFLFSLTEF